MSLHVYPADFFFILDSRLAKVWKINCPFGFLLAACCVWMDCGAVALSASFFPFGVLDGRC